MLMLEDKKKISSTLVVCPTCKKESGKKTIDFLNGGVIEDYFCPHCGKIVFSSKPEIKKYVSSYTLTSSARCQGMSESEYFVEYMD